MAALPGVGDLVADKYRIETLLGEGGMGAVYAARHEMMDKPVALKWLLPRLASHAEARDRFIREARAAARVRHPNVVEVYDVGVHNGALFMVMELLEGQSLEELFDGDEKITIPTALRILIGAMQGVQAAHEQGIIHRDIKPANLFVVRDPRTRERYAKVLDFGISKLTEDQQRGAGITSTGLVIGTPSYMSIEQIQGDKDLDLRTDVYAFGVLLYQALSGQLPYTGDSVGALAIQLVMHQPPRPKLLRPELPTALDNVIMKAMAVNRDDRYANMGELIDALLLLGSTEGFLNLMTTPSEAPPQLTPRTPVPSATLRTERLSNEAVGSDPTHASQPPAGAETPFGIDTTGGAMAVPAGVHVGRQRLYLVLGALAALGIVMGLWLWQRGGEQDAVLASPNPTPVAGEVDAPPHEVSVGEASPQPSEGIVTAEEEVLPKQEELPEGVVPEEQTAPVASEPTASPVAKKAPAAPSRKKRRVRVAARLSPVEKAAAKPAETPIVPTPAAAPAPSASPVSPRAEDSNAKAPKQDITVKTRLGSLSTSDLFDD